MKKKTKRKKIMNDKVCDPWMCNECVYLGEGDFLCEKYNEMVLSDWEPTDDFLMCVKEHIDLQKGEKHEINAEAWPAMP